MLKGTLPASDPETEANIQPSPEYLKIDSDIDQIIIYTKNLKPDDQITSILPNSSLNKVYDDD